MKPSLKLILLGLASLLAASCYPYPENQPPRKHQPNLEAQQKEAAEKAKAEAEAKKKAAEGKKKDSENGATEEIEKKDNLVNGPEKREPQIGDKPNPPVNPGSDEPKPKPTKPKTTYSVAKKAPGKEGFVLSPYNNKLVDVRGIAPGTLVRDPTYPPEEKKRFIVP